MSPISLFMVKLGLFWPFLCPGGPPKLIKYWNNALICWFKLYASIHSHWECLETARVLNSGIIQIWGKFPVIFGHFWVILCPEGLQTTQNCQNNVLAYQFQLYAPIHSHWECLETAKVLNSGIIQIWVKFSVIFGHFWVILCPEGLQTPQN